jgi:hypothetical protein
VYKGCAPLRFSINCYYLSKKIMVIYEEMKTTELRNYFDLLQLLFIDMNLVISLGLFS